MRPFALAFAAAACALAGCHMSIGSRGVDPDGPRPVSQPLHAALGPAIDRAVKGDGWGPEFLERGAGGGNTQVLLRETSERKGSAVFRCRPNGQDGRGELVVLSSADRRRILTALHWDLHAVVLGEECDVTHSKVTDAGFEIDYRHSKGGGSIRATLEPEVVEGIPSKQYRLEVVVREKARHPLGVRIHGPLVSLLGQAME